MTKKSDDIEWGPWFIGLEIEPYNHNRGAAQYMGLPGKPSICITVDPVWERNLLYRVPADHPHYTPEGQLYYLKQQFPDVAWVQALEAPEPVDPVLLKAREIYQEGYPNKRGVSNGSWDSDNRMRLVIEGIKAGMDMAK